MKGVLFYQQLEIRIDVEGEIFHQGDSVPCLLSVKNRSTTSQTIDSVVLALVHGDLRKIKAKSESAFEEIARAGCPAAGILEPGAQHEIPWTFQLDKNCMVTDNAHSLCLLYGPKHDSSAEDHPPQGPPAQVNSAQVNSALSNSALGHLQLPVQPHRDIEGILLVFETSFQFVPKGCKSKAGWVVAKLKAPKSSRFTALDELELAFRFENARLLLRYTFKLQRLAATPATLEVKKHIVNFNQELLQSDYTFTPGFVDSNLLEPKIVEALASLSTKRAGP